MKGAHLCTIPQEAPGPPPTSHSPCCSPFPEAVPGDQRVELAGWLAGSRSGPGWTALGRRGRQDRGSPVTWHKEGSHQALLVGNCRGHVGAVVPGPMVRQEERFTRPRAPAVVFSLRSSECVGWRRPASEQTWGRLGGEGQGLSGLPSGLLLAMLAHQSAAQPGPPGPIQAHLEDSLLGDPGCGGPEPRASAGQALRLLLGQALHSAAARKLWGGGLWAQI